MSTASPLAVTPRATSHEIAASASAALAKATIEAKFVIAIQRPRSILNARASILDACKRPAFAEGAWYRIPNRGEGFTIRFAEQALASWRNVDVAAVTAWEDEERRLVRITVTDLESNLSFADEVLLNKTVERRKLKDGQEPISTRETSDGSRVYLVACTEDELLLKVNSAKSKIIRNSGLRLIPQDILEEAELVIRETMTKGGTDTQAATKKIADGFAGLGVPPSELELYIGHSLSTLNPKELTDLRGIFAAIRDEKATWADFRPSATPAAAKESADDQIPGAETPAQQPRSTTPAPAAEPQATPQERIQAAMSAAGITFDEFAAWAAGTGQITDPSSLSGYMDLPTPVATRLARALRTIVATIQQSKGGAK